MPSELTLLELYCDGDCTQVIPPPDPVTDHVVLRYSDFFGSENVPAARDPDEPVELEMRILRMKINSLVRLTRAQNESFKRKAAEEEETEGAGVKRVRAQAPVDI